MRSAAILFVLAAAAPAARADTAPEVQADVGLSVLGLAYEQPIGDTLAVQGEACITSTYFAPWFDAGDRVDGYEIGLRASWFPRGGQRGLYVAPYVRGVRVTAKGVDGSGLGVSAGAFVGWAWRVTDRIDVRAGLGAQYYDYKVGGTGIASPFFGIDGVIGYRL